MNDNNDEIMNEQNSEETNQNDALKTQHDKDSEEIAKLKNDYLYLRAEFDNYKKNAIKERSDLLKYGGERMAYDMLNILDVFEKALQTKVDGHNFASFENGIKLTAQEFKKVLEKHGILEIPSLGTTFDPNLHEALSQVPTKDKKDDTIIELFRKGYKYHDKVLRHSQVVVAKEVKD